MIASVRPACRRWFASCLRRLAKGCRAVGGGIVSAVIFLDAYGKYLLFGVRYRRYLQRNTAHVRRVLDLSTGHLPYQILTDGLHTVDGVVAYQFQYGWWLWVPDHPVEHAADQMDPPPLVIQAIQRYARLHGCDYVLLDADGPTDPHLPIYQHH